MGKPKESERRKWKAEISLLKRENEKLHGMIEAIKEEGDALIRIEREINASLIFSIGARLGAYYLLAWNRHAAAKPSDPDTWRLAFSETCCEAIVRLLIAWTPDEWKNEKEKV